MQLHRKCNKKHEWYLSILFIMVALIVTRIRKAQILSSQFHIQTIELNSFFFLTLPLKAIRMIKNQTWTFLFYYPTALRTNFVIPFCFVNSKLVRGTLPLKGTMKQCCFKKVNSKTPSKSLIETKLLHTKIVVLRHAMKEQVLTSF